MLEPDINKRFGLVIRQWRLKASLSQEELAARAGLHRTYVSDVERGRRNPSLQSIAKLTNALKVSVSVLFQTMEGACDPAANLLAAEKKDGKANPG
jgi:transcriptional regulator with XRE-family HTH domain